MQAPDEQHQLDGEVGEREIARGRLETSTSKIAACRDVCSDALGNSAHDAHYSRHAERFTYLPATSIF